MQEKRRLYAMTDEQAAYAYMCTHNFESVFGDAPAGTLDALESSLEFPTAQPVFNKKELQTIATALGFDLVSTTLIDGVEDVILCEVLLDKIEDALDALEAEDVSVLE